MEEYDIIIIGAGPAGLTAGIYAGRRKMKTLILERGVIGGQMTLAHEVENYPGVEKTNGMELAKVMEQQAKKFGCTIRMEEALDMDLKNKVITTSNGKYKAKAVILATGGSHKKAEIENEEKFVGRGVSYCANCDAPFFKGKRVVVVGGSDSAISAALFAAEYAKEVHLIHRREEFRAEQANLDKMRKAKIDEVTCCIVVKIDGDKKVEKITLEDTNTKKRREMPIDGLFIYIGTTPTTELAKKAGVKVDKLGYIEKNDSKETNLAGVYAAGDATGGIWQISQAVGDGAVAAVSAYKYTQNSK